VRRRSSSGNRHKKIRGTAISQPIA